MVRMTIQKALDSSTQKALTETDESKKKRIILIGGI